MSINCLNYDFIRKQELPNTSTSSKLLVINDVDLLLSNETASPPQPTISATNNTSLISARSTLNNKLLMQKNNEKSQLGQLPTPSILNQQLPPPIPELNDMDDEMNINEEEEATKALMSQIKF